MSNLEKSQVLVLGAGGRLGQLLRRAWRRSPPMHLEPLYQSRTGSSDFQWKTGQITGPIPPADSIIALWGKTSGSSDAHGVNTSLAFASLAAARASGARRVLHFSSAAVYGPVMDANEETPARPVNDYGRSKLAMEQVVADFPDEGIAHCCLRLANVVGSDSLAKGLSGPAPIILDRFADGHGPKRSYIGMGHLAQVLVGLCTLPANSLPDIINVTGPAPVEMQALAEAADKEIRWQDAPPAALQVVSLSGGRMSHLLPDVIPLATAQDLIADWQALTPPNT